MMTVKYGKMGLVNIDTEVAWGHAVKPKDFPVAFVDDLDNLAAEGTITATLTDYGRAFLKDLINPKACATVDDRTMEEIKKAPRGSILEFGGHSYRIYRRDYKRNKVWCRRVI